jgi:methyl-accepting chemotaxis protein
MSIVHSGLDAGAEGRGGGTMQTERGRGMKALNLKTILLAIVATLGILVVGLAGNMTWQMMERRSVAETGQEINAIGDLLLASAGAWAVERGVTVTALNSSGAADADRRSLIERQREAGDGAFRAALERLDGIGQGSHPLVGEARAAFNDLGRLRDRASQDIGRSMQGRSAGIAGDWVRGMTGLIEATQDLRRALEFELDTVEARMAHYQQMKDAIWVMSEFAGRERAMIGGAAAQGNALSAEQVQELSRNRGRVEMAWQIVMAVAAKESTSPEIRSAVDNVRSVFFDRFGATRRSMIEAGLAGEAYPVSAADWIARSTEAIDTVLALSERTGTAIEALAARTARDGFNAFVIGLVLLSVAIVVVAGAFWVILGRVVRPLEGIRSAMTRLAEGDKEVAIPGLGRTDEIGGMADAVEVFRQNAIEMERLQADQAEQERRAEEEKRRALNELADSFMESVGGVVSSVGSAAEQMKTTAQAMSGTAEETNRQATAVAAASEEASTNVRSVASAADELSSSITEISRQVQDAARISNDAVTSAENTNRKFEGLAEAAQRIGNVVELINDIAAQTNLLALNATIEAARAGEAGKGFAVVAAEVKDLAGQTAKATEEIGQQIGGIQASTEESVTAIQEIGQTIGTINEISAAIASAVEEQGAATQEIARNVQQASSGTEEVNENISGVSQAATETGTAAAQVLGSAEELAGQAERLRTEVERFVERVRAA